MEGALKSKKAEGVASDVQSEVENHQAEVSKDLREAKRGQSQVPNDHPKVNRDHRQVELVLELASENQPLAEFCQLVDNRDLREDERNVTQAKVDEIEVVARPRKVELASLVAGEERREARMDRVGAKRPSEHELVGWGKAIGQVMEEMKPYGVVLHAEERKGMLRFRPGGDEVVKLVANLAASRNFSMPRVSVEAMKSDLALAQSLKPLLAEIEGLQLLVADTIRVAERESWMAATAFYSALASQTRVDPELAMELKPAVEFFATGKRKPKAT